MESTTKTQWAADPAHSEISFSAKHLMITKVQGVFKDFSAIAFTNGDNFITSDVEFSMKTASVDTGAPDRDAHLRSADFFDAETFTNATFKGTSVENVKEDSYILNGDLTIRGVTQPVKLDVEFNGRMKDPWGNEKIGYTITGKINRKDWGLNWNATLEAGGVLVSDEIKIRCEVQLIQLS